MKNQKEVWLPVKGYEGIYEVSNFGNVKSLSRLNLKGSLLKEKILKINDNGKGYKYVSLYKCNKRKNICVHQLVAMAFLNHKPNGHTLVVHHKDNNKSNNNVDNLEIITQRENSYTHYKGSSKYKGVCFCNRDKKFIASIRIKGKNVFIGYYISEYEASKAYQKKLKEISC